MLSFAITAALLFISFVQSAGQEALRKPEPPVNDRQILLYVSVRPEFGPPIDSLKQDHFRIRTDSGDRQITFFSDSPVPASVAVLFDLSLSTPADALKEATRALYLFRRASLPTNQYLVATFDEKDNVLMDWTNQEDMIVSTLDQVRNTKPKHETALYDALYGAIERMNSAPQKRRVLILFSDGVNDGSRHYGFKETRELLKRSDVTLYVIGNNLNNSSDVMHAQDQMRELADLSGGVAVFLSPEAKHSSYAQPIFDTFAYVAADLRYNYTLGFVPDKGGDGKWHPLRIVVDHPDLKARKIEVVGRTRKGYF